MVDRHSPFRRFWDATREKVATNINKQNAKIDANEAIVAEAARLRTRRLPDYEGTRLSEIPAYAISTTQADQLRGGIVVPQALKATISVTTADADDVAALLGQLLIDTRSRVNPRFAFSDKAIVRARDRTAEYLQGEPHHVTITFVADRRPRHDQKWGTPIVDYKPVRRG